MCSTITEPGKPERVLTDCGRCTCPTTRTPGHSPVAKQDRDKAGNVTRAWTECGKCGIAL